MSGNRIISALAAVATATIVIASAAASVPGADVRLSNDAPSTPGYRTTTHS